MHTHLAIDLIWVALAVAVYNTIGTTGLTIAMVVLAVCHLATVAVIVWAVRRRDQRTRLGVNAAEAGFHATINALVQTTGTDRARVVAAYRRAVAVDPQHANAQHVAFREAVYTGRIERTEQAGTRRAAIADWDDRIPGAAGVLLAVLTCDRVGGDVFDRLTGWWTQAGMPLYCPTPDVTTVPTPGRRFGLRLAA